MTNHDLPLSNGAQYFDNQSKISNADTLESVPFTTDTDTIDLIPPDSIAIHSMETDSIMQLKQDSIILIEESRISAISGYIKPETQRPLPSSVELSVTEPSGLGGEYYFAIIRELITEYIEDNTLYAVADGKIKSSAYVVGKPVIDALIDYRTRHVFNSTYEAEQFADTLESRFMRNVNVALHLRSYDIHLLDVAREELFEIYVLYNDQRIFPETINAYNIRNRVVENQSWFERRVELTFPRRVNDTDFWAAPALRLSVKPKFEGIELDSEEGVTFLLN